jgi:hypothetical protein
LFLGWDDGRKDCYEENMQEFMESLSPKNAGDLSVGLNAVIVSVVEDEPCVLIVSRKAGAAGEGDLMALPFGPFEPWRHRTLDAGLRSWVEAQTGLKLGYVEQLYTFGDQGRDPREIEGGPRVISIGYLVLTRRPGTDDLDRRGWHPWYQFFPWEDWRRGRPSILRDHIEPRLLRWIGAASGSSGRDRRERAIGAFALEGTEWNEELVLERYELLYEAGLVAEAYRHGGVPADQSVGVSRSMTLDHRRILATGISRLRGKIKYRPVVFELMPPEFTLLNLQRLIEALSGKRLHKQNFRRLVEREGLVESTGKIDTHTGGRPAQLFGFRR